MFSRSELLHLLTQTAEGNVSCTYLIIKQGQPKYLIVAVHAVYFPVLLQHCHKFQPAITTNGKWKRENKTTTKNRFDINK